MLTIDTKFKDVEYLIVEKGLRANKDYCDKQGFDSESNARGHYNNKTFQAHGELNSPSQIKSIKLYEKAKSFFESKIIVWRSLEKRENLHFTGMLYS